MVHDSYWRIIIIHDLFNNIYDLLWGCCSFCVITPSLCSPIVLKPHNTAHDTAITYVIFVQRQIEFAELLTSWFLIQPAVCTFNVVKLFIRSEDCYNHPDGFLMVGDIVELNVYRLIITPTRPCSVISVVLNWFVIAYFFFKVYVFR